MEHVTGEIQDSSTAQPQCPTDYSLDTDKISVYSYDGELLGEITSWEKLSEIVDAINFELWESTELPDGTPNPNIPSSVPFYFLDLHNGTAIALDEDSILGSLGIDVELVPNDICKISESIGSYFIPDNLASVIENSINVS